MLLASPGGIYGTLGICLAQLILVAVIGLVSYIWKHAKKSGNNQGAYAKKRDTHRDNISNANSVASWNVSQIDQAQLRENGFIGNDSNKTQPRLGDANTTAIERADGPSLGNFVRPFLVLMFVCILVCVVWFLCSVPSPAVETALEYNCDNTEVKDQHKESVNDDIVQMPVIVEEAFEPLSSFVDIFGRDAGTRLPRVLGCRLGSLANRADYVERSYKVLKTRLLEKRITVSKERDFHGLKGFSDVRFMADTSSGRVNCIALLRRCDSLDDAERCFQRYMAQLEEIYDVRMREDVPAIGSQMHRIAVRVFDDFEVHLVCSLVDFNQNPDPTVFISFTMR